MLVLHVLAQRRLRHRAHKALCICARVSGQHYARVGTNARAWCSSKRTALQTLHIMFIACELDASCEVFAPAFALFAALRSRFVFDFMPFPPPMVSNSRRRDRELRCETQARSQKVVYASTADRAELQSLCASHPRKSRDCELARRQQGRIIERKTRTTEYDCVITARSCRRQYAPCLTECLTGNAFCLAIK